MRGSLTFSLVLCATACNNDDRGTQSSSTGETGSGGSGTGTTDKTGAVTSTGDTSTSGTSTSGMTTDVSTVAMTSGPPTEGSATTEATEGPDFADVEAIVKTSCERYAECFPDQGGPESCIDQYLTDYDFFYGVAPDKEACAEAMIEYHQCMLDTLCEKGDCPFKYTVMENVCDPQ